MQSFLAQRICLEYITYILLSPPEPEVGFILNSMCFPMWEVFIAAGEVTADGIAGVSQSAVLRSQRWEDGGAYLLMCKFYIHASAKVNVPGSHTLSGRVQDKG